jgi:hypothetical protein
MIIKDAAIDKAPALDPRRVLQPTAKSKKNVPIHSEANLLASEGGDPSFGGSSKKRLVKVATTPPKVCARM